VSRYLLLSLLTLIEQLAALAVQFFIARRYGAHGEVDAWIVGASLPALFSAVAGSIGGQLVMPLLAKSREERGEEGFQTELAGFLNLFFWISCGTALALAALPGFWTGLLAPGLASGTRDSAGWYLAVLSAGLIPGLAGLLYSQAAQASGKYVYIPLLGLASALVPLGAVLLAPSGAELRWMAAAQVLAALVSALFANLLGVRSRWVPSFRLSAGTGELLRRTLPALLIVAATRLNHTVDNFFASFLPEGELSVLGYAVRATSILQAALAAPVISVVFSDLSALAAKGDWTAFSAQAAASGRRSVFLSVGFAAVIAGLGPRLATLLFGFGAGESAHLARCFVALSGIVAFAAWGSLLTRVCFAARMDRVAVIFLGIVPLLFNILLDWLLVGRYGITGLAAVTSLNALIGLPVVDAVLRREGRISGPFYGAFFRSAGCALLTGILLWNLPPLFGRDTLSLAIETALLGFCGLAAYSLLTSVLGETALRELLEELRPGRESDAAV